MHYLTGPETIGTLLVTVSGLGSNHSGMGKPIVRWVVPFPHLQETTLEGWHRERQEGVPAQQAARRNGELGRSMSASAWRTLWTVAKPKTPMVDSMVLGGRPLA